MSNCDICGEKIGFFDAKDISYSVAGTKIGLPLNVCEKCLSIFEDMKKGDVDAFLKVTYPLKDEDKKKTIMLFAQDVKALDEVRELYSKFGPATSVDEYPEIEKQKATEEKEKATEEENYRIYLQEKEKELSKILISSGFNFDGYRIVKYSGYISGDDACQIPRYNVFGNNNGQNLTDALVKIRRKALVELKEAAFNLGCNAVIGVDFDYITLEPERHSYLPVSGATVYEPYVICVTANGNAVIIEKE